MEPETFSLAGISLLIVGFGVSIIGGIIFGQVYFCLANLSSCGSTPADLTNRIGYSIPLLLFGNYLILIGGLFTAAGHITEHLPGGGVLEPSANNPLRVCVKCGRQVDPSGSFCPSCGNPVAKP